MPFRISDFMRTVLRATTAAAARSLLGASGTADLAAHEADTTSIHGIADTSVLVTTAGATFAGDVSVPDEAYGAGWNGSAEVPTKNAVFDKIETLGGSGLTSPQVLARTMGS